MTTAAAAGRARELRARYPKMASVREVSLACDLSREEVRALGRVPGAPVCDGSRPFRFLRARESGTWTPGVLLRCWCSAQVARLPLAVVSPSQVLLIPRTGDADS